MVRIRNSNGHWVENEEDNMHIFRNYFMDLFEGEDSNNVEEALFVVSPRITKKIRLSLDRSFEPDEVLMAIFQRGANKAPDPNGLNGFFFHTYCEIVGLEVTTAVLHFFFSSIMPSSLNYTDLILIPKVVGPKEPSLYRTISLCNFLYTIISKILVSRLKSILPNIISKEQSTFVTGRLIQDNIAVIHEVFHFLNRKK